MKIWVKTYEDNKIIKSIMWQRDFKYSRAEFHNYVYEICSELDIPSPLILKTHIKSFESFNIAKFVKSDFIDAPHFDYMTLEHC